MLNEILVSCGNYIYIYIYIVKTHLKQTPTLSFLTNREKNCLFVYMPVSPIDKLCQLSSLSKLYFSHFNFFLSSLPLYICRHLIFLHFVLFLENNFNFIVTVFCDMMTCNVTNSYHRFEETH